MRQAPQPPQAVAEPQGPAPLLLAAWVGAGEGFTRSSISIDSEVHSSKETSQTGGVYAAHVAFARVRKALTRTIMRNSA
jgi:hypothetical protein